MENGHVFHDLITMIYLPNMVDLPIAMLNIVKLPNGIIYIYIIIHIYT